MTKKVVAFFLTAVILISGFSIGASAAVEKSIAFPQGSSSVNIYMEGKQAAVRDADGIIRIETKRLKPRSKGRRFLRLPIIRGVVSFFSSLVMGSKVLMRSAEVYGESEPSKFEKWVSKKLKIDIMSVVITFSLLLGLALAIFLFMWLPQVIRVQLENLFATQFSVWAKNFIEGGLKLLIFILYILLASLLKDIKRTFMYHGAEHKTISCYEAGLELTPENAKKCSRIHDRCGTTFMVFVMLISIIVFAITESLIGASVEKAYRVLLKIALLPLVAGFSYELLKLLAKTKSVLVIPLKLPGMLLQKVTTREPDEKMIEVAISAFNAVMAMDEDQTISEQEFVIPQKLSQLVEKTKEKLCANGIDEPAEAEWIISILLDVKRSDLSSDKLVSPKNIDKINKVVDERITGRPLWYCIGDTDFCGYKIKVDERVLIPRPETELLVENALKCVNKESKVLDLCTGSGAIAIAVKKQSDAVVTAVDVSNSALDLAKENAKLCDAEIEFIESDMFSALNESGERKFDVIISNPPYIKSEDILTLQKEVREFEPTLALDGGADGYDFYKIIAENAVDYLNKNGVLFLECGIGQAKDIASMLKGFSSVEIIKDYENIERIIKAVN